MEDNYDLLLAILLACLIAWQLASGRTLGGRHGWGKDTLSKLDWKDTFTIDFREGFSRERNPGQYWFLVLSEVVVLVIFLIYGAASWEWISS